ncbi:Hypothetical predicted protein [Pelobates cultripes]|uniref:Uncharacterized protein n=1 Tax=Pelobates cultripes TaxID=61616 RepID=A0AAD1RMV4_PELCU|nr:Hypothetical predicted protein [Pelobates cultripes]
MCGNPGSSGDEQPVSASRPLTTQHCQPCRPDRHSCAPAISRGGMGSSKGLNTLTPLTTQYDGLILMYYAGPTLVKPGDCGAIPMIRSTVPGNRPGTVLRIMGMAPVPPVFYISNNDLFTL